MRWLQVLLQAIEPGDVVVIDQRDCHLVTETLPDEVLNSVELYSEDACTRGTVELNLLVERDGKWGIGTQLHHPIEPGEQVWDCRRVPGGSFADWLTGLTDPLLRETPSSQDAGLRAGEPVIDLWGAGSQCVQAALQDALESYVEAERAGPDIERPQPQTERLAYAAQALEAIKTADPIDPLADY